MKAMILAAGMGTRLLPLTQDKPKALVECAGISLLEHALDSLKNAGVYQIIINVHHFGNQIVDFIKQDRFSELEIEISDESDVLLDSGGSVMHAKSFLDGVEPFLVWNVDVVSDISIPLMLLAFHKMQPLALLAVRNRFTSRNLLFDDKNLLCGWRNNKSGETKMVQNKEHLKGYAFSGIQIMHPDVFKFNSLQPPFSLTDMYLSLAKEFPIGAYLHDEDYWFDLGTPESIQKANAYFQSLKH